MQHGQYACRHVEADGVAGAAGGGGIVGDQDQQLAFGARRPLQPDEICDAQSQLLDAVGFRAIEEAAKAEPVVTARPPP